MAHKLQPGLLLKLAKEEPVELPFVVQAHQSKHVDQGDFAPRLRLMINDGEYSMNAIFKPTEEEPSIEGFARYAYIQVNQCCISPNSGKCFLVLQGVTVDALGEKPTKTFKLVDTALAEASGAAGQDTTSSRGATPGASSANANKYGRAAAPSNPKYENLYNIDQLSPYQNSWTIKARVSYKGDMRTWSNQRGEGKLFNVNLLDETGEIRATAFNATADKFYDLLKEGKVYYVSKCSMQIAKPQFSNLKHQYELHFDLNSVVEECDDISDVPKIHYDFVPLSKLQNLEPNSIIDVIGVVKEVNDPFQIVAKSTGKPYDRRDITIVDSTHFSMSVGLWNKIALEFDIPPGTVIAIKGARVGDFGGRSLSLTPSASIIDSPDIPEAHALQGWYGSQGKFENFKSISNDRSAGHSDLTSKEAILQRKTIKQITDEGLGNNQEKADYFNLKATISFIRTENISYPACLTEGCSKKVIEQSDGSWRCEKCDKSFPEPNHRYILTCSVLDHTGQAWVTFFDETATKLMGKSANELVKLKQDSDDLSNESVAPYEFKKFMSSITFKEFALSIRARPDDYNGTTRVRLNVVGVSELNLNNEIDGLVDSFGKYNL